MAKTVIRILGQGGRTTIPDEFRQELFLQPGEILSFTLNDDDSITVRPGICAGADGDFIPTPAPIPSGVKKPSDGEFLVECMKSLPANEQFSAMSELFAHWARISKM